MQAMKSSNPQVRHSSTGLRGYSVPEGAAVNETFATARQWAAPHPGQSCTVAGVVEDFKMMGSGAMQPGPRPPTACGWSKACCTFRLISGQQLSGFEHFAPGIQGRFFTNYL